jgi:hypothetical protein
VRGRSRVLLIPPSASYAGLYPFPVAHPYDGYSMLDDFTSPDLGAWPGFAGVRGEAAILAPGDVLLLPRNWWLHLKALPDSTSLPPSPPGEHTVLHIRLLPGARPRHPAAALPAIGRKVEILACAPPAEGGEGVPGGRAWLARIAAGSEEAGLQLHTLAGYRRAQLSAAVIQEVGEQLCPGAALPKNRHLVRAFLAQLIDRRMMPTPWLNATFREPLYLKDRPVVVEDTRSEWERRFPQLFARKLRLEGFEPPETPISVLNPSHPEFVGRAAK